MPQLLLLDTLAYKLKTREVEGKVITNMTTAPL